MAQEFLHLNQATLSRRLGLPRLSRAVLSAGFATIEGVAAGAILLGSALVYHMAIHHVAIAAVPIALYLGYGALVGLFYAVFSARAVARFLDSRAAQHAVLADAAMAWTAAFGVALLAAFLAGLVGDLSRVSLTASYLIGLPVLLVVRNIGFAALRSRISDGLLPYHRVAVIGAREDVARFLRNGQLWQEGYEVIHIKALEDMMGGSNSVPEPAMLEFAEENMRHGADTVVFVGGLGDLDGLEDMVHQLKRFAINVVDAPATDNRRFKFIDVMAMGPNNVLRFVKKPMGDGAVFVKRSFDIVGAVVGLLLLLPLFLIVAVLIKLGSHGPVFFRQERRGLNGETFFIWKFRSMSVMESGNTMVQAVAHDPRITRLGRILRLTSIDELPQLLNVLSGEMSLVGPRPHAIVHDAELGEQLREYAHRHRLKPGITGWAQVNGFRGETSTLEQIEGRTSHDLHYIENWSLALDVWIIILTFVSPKTRRNAF